MDPHLYSLARLLQSCHNHHSIRLGKQLHLYFYKKGLLGSTLSLANRLLQMYSRCGRMTDVEKLFDEMPERNCFSWNTVIDGYMKLGHREKSLEMLNLMPHKNDFSWNTVISGFAKAGELDIARNMFNEMPKRDAISWNVMIHSYARNGSAAEAVVLFKELTSEPSEISCADTYVFASVIGACTNLGALKYGKQIHAHILVTRVEFDSVLGSSLINFYGKCGDLDSASRIFDRMACPDEFSLSALISGYAVSGTMSRARRIFDRNNNASLVLWNSMISGHVSNYEEKEAFDLFNELRRKGVLGDSSTITSLLSACGSLGNINHCKQMHNVTCKVGLVNDVVISSALVDAYSKCGSPSDACKLFSELKSYDTILLNSMITVYSNCGRIEDAKAIFETMPSRSLISWNSIIGGLSQNGCPHEALDLFTKMNELDLRMDSFSLAAVISATASISSLELGEQVFARATVIGLDSDKVICTSLVDFYCKCGFVDNGRKLFDTMIKSDEISWNSMLLGYANNGHGSEALTLFNDMRYAGVKPTDITFTGVLSACDHCGLVEEGWKWFNAMKQDYNIDPKIEHYSCMVDLFARSGCIEDAINLIEHMPYDADASIWSSVLRGCVAHGCKTLGKKVAERIIELDPENSGAYVQLSSLFASSGDWEGSALVRNVMKEKQIQKTPGCSWAADC